MAASPFGKLLRKTRNDRKLSLRELARRSGVSFTHIQDVEGGRRDPFSPSKMMAIMNALGVEGWERHQLVVAEVLARGVLDITGISDAHVAALVAIRDDLRKEHPSK